jgi:hypothetical protein
MSDNIVPNAFFTIRLKQTVASHPFIRKRVIPALEKTHTKQVALLKQKYKKRFVNAKPKLSEAELSNWVWSAVLNDIVTHYATLQGKDRYLSFGLFSGGAHQFIVWDNYSKALYPTDNFSFDLPFSSDPDVGLFEEDDQVFLRGKLATAFRDGERYSVLKIYFYVVDTSEKREPGATTISSNVGILCEIPYFFLRSDRYETLQDTETTNKLLEMFELKRDDNNFEPLDFIPTDELGESYGISTWLEIGNDYAGVTIR